MHSSRYTYQQQEPELQHGQNTINQKKKWVINLSDVALTPTQEAVLAHGTIFAVTPKNPPILEYITSYISGLSKVKHQCCKRTKI